MIRSTLQEQDIFVLVLNAVARAVQDNNLDMSSFVRLVLTRVTKERHIPNATTQAAIRELESGGGTSVGTVDEFWDEIFK
ncbi:hypothetical protein [Photorhabdus tasmaniensis]|uniref:hypothetical protein n=1 Tax=Photorhabdus tasmaniensis TaxID=1004159 RepID=UPI00105C8027|nr:hypothetical protein [Photorhabdus tasmaniensis]